MSQVKEENAKLESLLSQVNKEKGQLAHALNDAQSGVADLLSTVDKVREFRDNEDNDCGLCIHSKP
jgi:hypothetical protein